MLRGGFRKVGVSGFPNLEPRWPPDPPTWSQDNLLTPQLGAKMAPGPPTWSQDGPQSSNLEPRWPPDPPTWSLNDHQTFKSTHGGGARRQAVGYLSIYLYIYITATQTSTGVKPLTAGRGRLHTRPHRQCPEDNACEGGGKHTKYVAIKLTACLTCNARFTGLPNPREVYSQAA